MYIKLITFIFVAIHSTTVLAKIEARWLGVAGVLLTDGETTLLFDPVVTKPTLKHWLLNAEFRANEAKVDQAIKDWGLTKVGGLFVSHEHFDHVSDAGPFAVKTDATIYGGDSLKRIIDFQSPEAKFQLVKDRETVTIGKFKVHIYVRKHAPVLHAIDFYFLPGPVPKDFNGKFYDFHEGEMLSYAVEHEEGTVIVDSGSHFFEPFSIYAGKILAYFMGIANKKSLQDMLDKNLGVIKPKHVIPVHFDFFFVQNDELEKAHLPGVDVAGMHEAVTKTYPEMKFTVPVVGEKITF